MNLNQITLPTLDVARAAAFYQTLGLQLIVLSLPHYARLVCEEAGTTLSLHQVESLPTGEGVWIYFEEEQLDQKVQELQEKGIVFDELPTDRTWLWREATLRDLDNNRLILYFAGENRLNPPWRIQNPTT